MIICGIRIQTRSLLQIRDLLFHSSEDLSLCCSADLISSNLEILISEALENWKQGKTTNLILTHPGYESEYSYLLSHLPFPLHCVIQETNRYNRIIKSNEFIAESPNDLNKDIKSTENFQVLKLNLPEQTFLTGKNVALNILVIVPKLSIKIEQLPIETGARFIAATINDDNIVQCMNFIGRANKTLSLASGPDKFYKILMKYKDRLGRVAQIMDQQNLTFQELIEQNRVLHSIDSSF